MAKKLNHGQSQESSASDQENPASVEFTGPEIRQKNPPQDKLADFSKMDSQQKADKIDEILGDSTELASAYQDI